MTLSSHPHNPTQALHTHLTVQGQTPNQLPARPCLFPPPEPLVTYFPLTPSSHVSVYLTKIYWGLLTGRHWDAAKSKTPLSWGWVKEANPGRITPQKAPSGQMRKRPGRCRGLPSLHAHPSMPPLWPLPTPHHPAWASSGRPSGHQP